MCAGTTLGASPPLVTIPWMRSVALMCCRSRPSDVWAIVSASAAFTPNSGKADAWDSLPVYSTSNIEAAMIFDATRSKGAGCTIMAAWTPANTPRSSSRILPLALPTSSAGVPITLTVRPTSSATAAAAMPAPSAVAAMMLWPHA